MTTPRNRRRQLSAAARMGYRLAPSLPRPLPQTYDADKTAPDTPTQDTPAEPPADGVAQGIRDEDGNTPPTPTLTPAPVPPHGNADGESQPIEEEEEDEDGDGKRTRCTWTRLLATGMVKASPSGIRMMRMLVWDARMRTTTRCTWTRLLATGMVKACSGTRAT